MKTREKILFTLIVILGFVFRFTGVNWDSNSHIHPDERFLTMVGTAMEAPHSFQDYLDPEKSTFNPANIGFNFFVYGVFPLTLNKIIAVNLGNDSYDSFVIQGRALSAFFDLIVVAAIFWAVLLLEKKYKLDPRIKILASLIYAVSVLPIQLSHFFAVDTFLNTFVFLSFCAALYFWASKKKYAIIIMAMFFGLALASKITAVYTLPLILFFLIDYSKKDVRKSIIYTVFNFTVFGITSYIVLKLANPYMFASGSIINPALSESFMKALFELKSLSSKESLYPPMVQWIHKTVLLFPLKNMVLWGFGIPAFVLFFIGAVRLYKLKITPLLFVLAWLAIFFLYQGTRTTSSMRYFIFMYPFMAIVAAFGLQYIYSTYKKIFFYIVLILVFIWPLMFFAIYNKPHSRVAASLWINKNIPPDKVILSEYWDDALPLGSVSTKKYQVIELPVFDADTAQKWNNINGLLEKGDYLILSSNRGWGSIPTVPERYPIMSRFYDDLFADKLSYKKVAEFTSYPSLVYLGIPITIPDDSSEEAFTVYDHPKVMIFKKIK